MVEELGERVGECVKSKVSITACMMVKNEAALLPQCLDSIRDLVDEIVIVDTGSTDNTIEIAKRYGAKIVESPWQKDFSLHRNESIENASGNWVLVIDPDEKLFLENGLTPAMLKQWLRGLPKHFSTVGLRMVDVQDGKPIMETGALRLFRKGQIRYERRAHNRPVHEGKQAFNTSLKLEHYGYALGEEKRQEKFRRSEELLMLDLQEHPEWVKTYFYLSELYSTNKNIDRAITFGEHYLALRHLDTDFLTSIYPLLISLYRFAGKHERSLELINQGLAEKPYDPDLAMCLADYGMMSQKAELILDGCRRFMVGYKNVTEQVRGNTGEFYFSVNDIVYTQMLYRQTIAAAAIFRSALNRYLNQDPSKADIEELDRTLNNQNLGVVLREHLKSINEIDGIKKQLADIPSRQAA